MGFAFAAVGNPDRGRPTAVLADRATVPNAVWVQTFNSAGVLVDTPFTLQLSR
jgi:hypothetical protein